MPFPNFDFCIVCEGIRPELGAKLTILGFFGVAPNVDVLVGDMARPLSVSFLVGFPPVSAQDASRLLEHSFVIVGPSVNILLQTPPASLNVTPGHRGIVAAGFILPPTAPG